MQFESFHWLSHHGMKVKSDHHTIMVYEPLYHDLQNGERMRDFLVLFLL